MHLIERKKKLKTRNRDYSTAQTSGAQAYLIKVDKKKSSLDLDTSNASENRMLITDATKDNDLKNIVTLESTRCAGTV